MEIPIPNKELVIPEKLKKVEVLGLLEKVTGSISVAFSFEVAVEEIIKNSILKIDDAGWRGIYVEPVKHFCSKCSETHRANNVSVGFDLLVVDVEGDEVDVFNSFSLNYWKPRMLIVELEDLYPIFKNYTKHREQHGNLRARIQDSGYSTVYRNCINTVFVLD